VGLRQAALFRAEGQFRPVFKCSDQGVLIFEAWQTTKFDKGQSDPADGQLWFISIFDGMGIGGVSNAKAACSIQNVTGHTGQIMRYFYSIACACA
jgi:hypothetical protein